ncbi:MAG: sulfatase-like hydrolase/transferase [Chitinophagaceae bacterium]
MRLKIKQALLFICFSGLLSTEVRSQRPNIIYIMTDDMGYGDLSGYGRKDYTTPNLDKLASQGIKFLNAYSAGPLCTPTRAAFMTGGYPARTHIGMMEPLTGTGSDSALGLTTEFPSIASAMQDAGYQTALIGKWHLGIKPRHSPIRNGFDYFFGFRSGAADYMSHKGDERKHDFFENDSVVYPKGYLTDLIARKTVDFIQQKHTKPFFIVVAFNAPHWPWQGPTDMPYDDSTDFRKGGSAATYAAMMKSLDGAVGIIMKALDEEKLAPKTLVIFTNDNGGERYSDNGGLAKSKGTLWEGGIRVPAFVRWPGRIVPGSITQQTAITMDWTKTILAAGGAKDLSAYPSDGQDLLPVLTGKKKNNDRTLYWRTFQRLKQKAVRDGDWKYLQDEKGEYLFNLALDPHETNDVKSAEPQIFQRLKDMYQHWEKTVLPPVPLANN